MPDPISWLIIAICVVFHFFFSASETALACCNRFKMQAEANDGDKRSALVTKVLDRFDRTLTAVLIGNNIAAIVISTVSTLLFVKYFTSTSLEAYASIISSIIMTFIVYIFGDTLPKVIARMIPDTFSKTFIYVIYVFTIIFYPIAFIFELIIKLFAKIFKAKNDEVFSEEDFENVVEKSEEQGVIEEEQADIIQSALDFANASVKQVFTPLINMKTISYDDLTHEKLNEILKENIYSRIPVYQDDPSNFIGILTVKTYVQEYRLDPHVAINSILQKPYFVSTKVMLVDLLEGFKKHHTHIALVTDSNNKVVGMVTMDDVLEELIDDISEPSLRERRHV